MGFLAGSVSLTRFRLLEAVPDSLWAEVPRRLKKHAFLDIDNNAEERSFGWVNFDEMLDSLWEVSPPEKGGYLAFSLRLDTRRVPPAVFKKHLRLALKKEEAQMEEQGRKFLSKDRKKELQEQVMLRLRARSFPIPALFDVVWTTQAQIVYLASTRSKIVEMFQELFTNTFDLHLDPLTPYALALQLMGDEARQRLDLVEAQPFV